MSDKARDLIARLERALAPLGAFRARAMFGGHGLYLDDVIFGILAFDRLYLKVDDGNRGAFVGARCEPFTYERREGRAVMASYWTCPAGVLRNPAALGNWVEGALAASRRAKKKTRPKRPKRSANPFL